MNKGLPQPKEWLRPEQQRGIEMDIDEALNKAREAAQNVDSGRDDEEWLLNEACLLVESFMDIDDWLKKGGMLPKDWQRG